MKKKSIPTLILGCLATLLSCNNDVAEINDPAMAPSISQVPTHFDQKILLETYTSSNCGVCPENDLLRDSLVSENPGRVYPVAIHLNDLLMDLSSTSIGGLNYMDSLFNPSGLSPAGSVNRKISGTSDLSPSNWRSNISSSLGTIPRCGLAIDATNIDGNNLKVVVHTGYSTTLSGEYRIHAYLVRSVFRSADTLYAQVNDFSINGPTPDTNSVFYLQPPLLINYAYKNVLVKVINDSGPEGDIIPAGSTYRGNDYAKTFTVDLTGINTNGLQVVAFVDKYGNDGTSHRIENAQLVTVGDVKNWN